ncbi:MFS transporter [bacterium]|nr:MAG: MFS transporter [bacterium]
MNINKFFSPENRRMSFILLTTFLNFLGFSIIIPIIPFLVQKYVGMNQDKIALYVGLLLSSYALCQFLAAPGLGMLSDRFGRRPILLISLLGSVIGYLVMGVGGALWMLFLGRVIDGLTGGNISTIYTYIADITEPKDRGKYYGLLGAAGGVGFMLGPAIGGLTAHISLVAPLFIAAVITLANVIWGYFVLPESLHPDHKLTTMNVTHLNPFFQFNHIFSVKVLRVLFLVTFIFFFAFSGLMGVNAVYMKDILNWNATQIGLTLSIIGVIDIITQGYLIRILLPKFGDSNIAIAGLVINGIGYLIYTLVAIFISPLILYVAVVTFALGDGLFEPAISGLISNSVDRKMQGRVQGANQGIQALTRIAGPLFAAFLYRYHPNLPYFVSAILIVVAVIVLILSLPTIKNHDFQE